MDSMNDILDELSVEGKVDGRPVFLTVLCVLTYIGSALYIAYASFTLLGFNELDDLNTAFMSDMNEELINYIRWIKLERYSMILGGVGCVVAATLMLKQRKAGFYIYIASQLLPLLVGFFAASSMGNFLGGFQFISFILWAIFPAGFIILYSLNYKHLK